MPNLNLIIGTFSEPYFAISDWLYRNREMLSSNKLQFQGTVHPYTQSRDCTQLLAWLFQDNPVFKEKGIEILARLEKDVQPGHDLVWLCKANSIELIEKINAFLVKSDVYSSYRIKPILLVQNQLSALHSWSSHYWKWKTLEHVTQIVLTNEKELIYGPYLSSLNTLFGSKNCFCLPFDNDFGKLGQAFAGILGLPQNACKLQKEPYPESYAGLDLAYALKDPLLEIYADDSSKIIACHANIARVEQDAGFEKYNQFPVELSQKIAAGFQDANAAFMEAAGADYDFLNNWPDYAPMPDPVPGLDEESCKIFVQAMEPELRTKLLEFFDKRGTIDSRQAVLAKTLEKHRLVTSSSGHSEQPVLSVLTMAYNHKDFILDCMESVSAQKTSFPIEHIIVDDCSEDGTQDIIDNYARTHKHVKPILYPYRSGGRNLRALFAACKSPYAALCDGDDYFIQPHKLQMQVDYLEKNTDCALCFHPVAVIFENGVRDNFVYPPISSLTRGVHKKYYLADLIKRNMIQTNSVVYRWRFRNGLPDWFRSDLCPGDWYWHLLHAEVGKVGFIPEIMSVYRRHDKACYKDAFINSIEHRRIRGLAELHAYKAINDHFQGRYFRRIGALANGVMSDMMELGSKTGDNSLLDTAKENFPEFALHFAKTLKNVISQDLRK